MNIQLGVYALQVALDRPLADEKTSADFWGRQAVEQEREDLRLPLR